MESDFSEIYKRVTQLLGIDTSHPFDIDTSTLRLKSKIQYLFYQNRGLLDDLLSWLERTSTSQILTQEHRNAFTSRLSIAVQTTKPISAQTSTDLHVALNNAATPAQRTALPLGLDDLKSPFIVRGNYDGQGQQTRPSSFSADSALATSAETSFTSHGDTTTTAATSFASDTIEEANFSTGKGKQPESRQLNDVRVRNQFDNNRPTQLPPSTHIQDSPARHSPRSLPWKASASNAPQPSYRQNSHKGPANPTSRTPMRQTVLNFGSKPIEKAGGSSGPSKKRSSETYVAATAEDESPLNQRASDHTKRPRIGLPRIDSKLADDVEKPAAAPSKDKSNKNKLVSYQISTFPEQGFGTINEALTSATGRKSVNRAANALPRNFASFEQVDLYTTPHSYTDSYRLMLGGSMRFNSSNKNTLFKTELNIARVERSNRAEREFGWHRILYLKMDMTKKNLPSTMTGQWDDFTEHLDKWLSRPHHLLDRKWRAFHLQEEKPAAAGQYADTTRVLRVALFATEGKDIRTMPLAQFLNRLLRFELNSQQAALKLYSRIDLALSRTTPSLLVDVDAYEIKPDPVPSLEVDIDRFRDPQLSHARTEIRAYDFRESMTDGNCRVSVGMMNEIRMRLDISTYPTAVQARFLGSKGVWFISAAYDTDDPEHLKMWIEVHHSQIKVRLNYEMLTKAERSFDVVRTNASPKPADLHRDFLPVLLDRGVAISDLCQLARTSIEEEKQSWSQAFEDPQELALLLYSKRIKREYAMQDNGSSFQSQSDLERALTLLTKGGFMPTDHEYMASLVLKACVQSFADDLKRFRFKCPKSTSLLGIAPDSDVLQPDEVFVSFSEAFEDKRTGEKVSSLAGKEVIIARDPTLRPSDIQKFMCVHKPELVHLKDVVVFSSRGRMPAAAKLQGGDYDGDTFWVSWEPVLTKNFLNAPVLQPQPYESLFIEREVSTFSELSSGLTDAVTIESWLSYCMSFKLKDNLLGQVTNYANDLTYHKGNRDATVRACADIHDYIIDKDKNGYIFDHARFQRFKAECGLPSTLPLPQWKKSLNAFKEQSTKRDERGLVKQFKVFCANACNEASNMIEHKNVHDQLWFKVMLPMTYQAIAELTAMLPDTKRPDPDLEKPVERLGISSIKGSAEALARATESSILPVFKKLQLLASRRDTKFDQEAHDNAASSYQNIMPSPEFASLADRYTDHSPTQWELVRASIAARMYHRSWEITGFRLFWLAAEGLCHVKAGSKTGARRIAEVNSILQPKRRKQDGRVRALGFQSSMVLQNAPSSSRQSLEPALDDDFWEDEYGDDFDGDDSIWRIYE